MGRPSTVATIIRLKSSIESKSPRFRTANSVFSPSMIPPGNSRFSRPIAAMTSLIESLWAASRSRSIQIRTMRSLKPPMKILPTPATDWSLGLMNWSADANVLPAVAPSWVQSSTPGSAPARVEIDPGKSLLCAGLVDADFRRDSVGHHRDSPGLFRFRLVPTKVVVESPMVSIRMDVKAICLGNSAKTINEPVRK